MASAPVLGATRSVNLDSEAFGARFNGPLIHESVRAEQAARRRGSASTKTRGLVRGGGAKPWRQKGSGRARAGSSRSPVWTGGGVVFGPHPRSYVFKVNRKERRAALRSALSLHAERGSLAVFDAAAFAEPSTRAAAALLAAWKEPRATLVVVAAHERGAALSFRNIARVAVLEPTSVGIADIIGAASLLCSDAGLAELTARATTAGDGADVAPSSSGEAPVAVAAVVVEQPTPAAKAPAATPKAAAAKAPAAPKAAAKPAAVAKTAAAPKAAATKAPAAPKAPAKPRASKPATPKDAS
jgi:large subunit ribosomal protein L4